MLKYLIAVTGSTVILAVLLGMLYAYVAGAFGRTGTRVLSVSVLAGLVCAAVYQTLRNTTKVIDKTGGNPIWNVRFFAAGLVALALFCVFNLPPLRRGKIGRAIALAGAALVAFVQVIISMPAVFGYPANFNLSGESVFSSAAMTRYIGYALGIALAVLIVLALYQASRRVELPLLGGLLTAALLVNAFGQVVTGMGTLYSKRYITGHDLFVFIRTVTNASDVFKYVVMAIALVIPIVLWLRSLNVREPYSNSAEHRKIRAKWRSIRRWSTTVAACFALVVVTLTWFTAIDNRVIELSPVEECLIEDGKCMVPLTQVEDGHLHRFAYTTEGGVAVRFIVIKKPNSSAYGVGLDACDICGETGYFERNGQVVCKLCDVVMNINTIGFKGGCNPIVVDYAVRDGFIIVETDALAAYEKTFK